ncbi:MAG: VWA domain-containing protein [Planctomycetota bacterium]
MVSVQSAVGGLMQEGVIQSIAWMEPTWWWLLFPAAIILAFFYLRSLSDFPPVQRRVSLVLRSIIALLLVASICGPVVMRSSQRQRILFAIDDSKSLDTAARQTRDRFLREAVTAAESAGAEVRFMNFDRNPGVVSTTWDDPESGDDTPASAEAKANTEVTAVVLPSDPDTQSGPKTGLDPKTQSGPKTQPDPTTQSDDGPELVGTNLAAALRTAVAAMPPSRVPRVVLLSDGNPTGNEDVVATADRGGVPVWTVPLPVRQEPEVQMTSVTAPSQVRQGEPFFVTVTVTSNVDGDAFIDLYRGDIRIGDGPPKTVPIKAGENVFRFKQNVRGKRQESFAARVRMDGDTLLDNNEASSVVYASGRPRVLLVDLDPEQTDSMRWALDEQSIDVEVRPPEGIPTQLDELQGYECLILSNVPATAMTMRQMDLIRLYVQDLGGGLIMIGGDQSFGLGGYYRTQIEEILPVRSNFEKEREKPSLAMMLVIDKSGSMGGEKIELAKDAARAAVELLGPRDSLGVIAFDGSAYMISELTSTSNKGAIADAISTIEASGGTNMYPAMVDALDALRSASAKLKHVILMTDGVSSPGDFEGAASEMSASRITLSTVALGQGSSEALLEDLARVGGGRYYFCDDPQSVPQVFAKETVEASQSAINELPFTPQVVRPTSVLEGLEMEYSPLLLGYVVTRPKPTSEFILASESGDPLLVWWRYGLGMTVAFTSDAKNRWAGEWLAWPDFGPFWAQVIRHAMRKQDNRGVYVDVSRQGERTKITMDSVDENGQFIDQAETLLTVIDPNLDRQKITMQSVAPGRFEATIPTPERGSYHLDLAQKRIGGEPSRTSRGITVGYPDEYRLLPQGTELLKQIAETSGGRFDPQADRIAEADQRTARDPVPLWPWLLMSALGLFIADVALRRVEVFGG